MIHYEYSCDFRGCKARSPSIAPHSPVVPGDWAHYRFLSQGSDKEECEATGHLCPEHAVALGKLLGAWTEAAKHVSEPPKRFR